LATGAGSGALIGAGIGSIVPVIGTGIGAAVGAILGGLIGAISGAAAANGASETEIKLVDTLTERVLKNGDMSTEALRISIDGLKGATDSEIEALIRTAESNAKLV
jgi:phage tail tape-measure protein